VGLARGGRGPHSGPWKVLVTEGDPELSRAPQSALFKMGVWPTHQHCGEEGLFLSTKGGDRLESCAFLFNQSQKKAPTRALSLLLWVSFSTPGAATRLAVN